MKTASMLRPGARVILLEISVEAQHVAGGSASEWVSSTGELQGLCVNCERRYDCTYPKPPGGVRSCDEYI
jgi:hypothetical protein